MDQLSNQPVRGEDLAMGAIQNKLSRGADLTMAETLIPVSVAAEKDLTAHGSVRTFSAQRPEMPEIVKGALADCQG